MSKYKTPIKNLYLTGASTHPGGGVFAASGHLRGAGCFEGRQRRLVLERGKFFCAVFPEIFSLENRIYKHVCSECAANVQRICSECAGI